MSISEQFHAAVATARNLVALDNISRLVWRAHAEGHLPDAAAQAAAEAVEARRQVLKGPRAPAAQKRVYAAPRPRRSPDRAKSIARRRSVALSGAIPSKIAASFTLGEVAALSVIGREVQRHGACELCVDAIAALAGTCRTIVQGTLRQARALGLIHVQERPQPGRKHLPNVVTIAAPDWRAWLRLGDRARKREHHENQLDTCPQIKRATGGATWRSWSVRGKSVAGPKEAQPSCSRKQSKPPKLLP